MYDADIKSLILLFDVIDRCPSLPFDIFDQSLLVESSIAKQRELIDITNISFIFVAFHIFHINTFKLLNTFQYHIMQFSTIYVTHLFLDTKVLNNIYILIQ